MFDHSALTIGESALIDHRAPGAGQLVDVKAKGKFILGVRLQISHQEVLLAPVEERHDRGSFNTYYIYFCLEEDL